MSVIGPRPQLVRDMVFMTDEQRMRHTAKPGLSGLAQVNGRNAITWEDKLDGNKTNVIVTGPKVISKTGMFNYCWPGCLTVMYDRKKIGLVQIADIKKNNDYAIWLKICKKTRCYLLDEVLAEYRRGRSGSISTHGYKELIKWHYRLFRFAEKENPIGTVVLPRVANLFQKSNLDEAKRYVYQAFRVVWLLAIPIMFGLMGVSSVFIPLFLGSGFDDAIGLLCIFSILVLVVSLAYVTGISYLIPTKQQNVYTAAVTIAVIVNFCMNLILIPRVGVFGAAIASIVAETIGTAIQIIYCISKKQLNAVWLFIARCFR